MTIEELRKRMIEVEKKYEWMVKGITRHDAEGLHSDHDDLLLEYINDLRVCAIFRRTTKWYA